MKKWAWGIGVFVVIVAGVLVFANSSAANEFPFISEHNGKAIPVPSAIFLGESTAGKSYRAYAFDGDSGDVEASIKRFAVQRGWKESAPGLGQYGYWGTSPTFAPPESSLLFVKASDHMGDASFPSGATCYVMVPITKSWLAQKWETVRRWFQR